MYICLFLFHNIANIDKSYRTSDCAIDDVHQQQLQLLQQQHQADNILYATSSQQNSESPNAVSNRSPLQLRQASPFPMESTNSRRIHYANPQERLRSSGKFFPLLSHSFSVKQKLTLLSTSAICSSSDPI